MKRLNIIILLVIAFTGMSMYAYIHLVQLQPGTAGRQIVVSDGPGNTLLYRDAESYIKDTLGISGGGSGDTLDEIDTFYQYNGNLMVHGDTILMDTSLMSSIASDSLPGMLDSLIHFGDYEQDANFYYNGNELVVDNLSDLNQIGQLMIGYLSNGDPIIGGNDYIGLSTPLLSTHEITLYQKASPKRRLGLYHQRNDNSVGLQYSCNAGGGLDEKKFFVPSGSKGGAWFDNLDLLELKEGAFKVIDIQDTVEVINLWGDSGDGILRSIHIDSIVGPTGADYVQYSDTAAMLSNYATFSDIPDDTNLSQEEIEDYVGDMVVGNSETGISVFYNDINGTLNFDTDDFLLESDTAAMLSNYPTFSDIPDTYWQIDGGNIYYDDGVEIRSTGENFAEFIISTIYEGWQFLVTGSASGGTLRISPQTADQDFEIRDADLNEVFTVDLADQSIYLATPDFTNPTTPYNLIWDATSNEVGRELAYRKRETFIESTAATSIGTSTTVYTRMDNMTEWLDETALTTIGVGDNTFQVDVTGAYKISGTIGLTATTDSKEFYTSIISTTNNEINGNFKDGIIVDTSPTTDVNNQTVSFEFYVSLATGTDYSLGIKRADTNSGGFSCVNFNMHIQKISSGG